MKIAVEGCAHGELDIIYESVLHIQEKENVKIDLLICCGDFQSCRNENDLRCMAIPPKFYNMCSFYKYYSGEKQAPVLTLFIGGNHEASNYLQELPYGGWVAPNIYYLGYAGVVNFGGLRIAGLSGIYKDWDYMKGRFEAPPYSENSKRSVYHIRNLDVFRLKQLKPSVDVFLSHDWPTDVWNYGNKNQLVRFKPYFREDMETGKLGSKPAKQLLLELQPSYWFAAHLHCKFSAVISHDEDKVTRFLALDKCLPKRRYLQILDISHDPSADMELRYDLEWLAILKMTNHLTSIKSVLNYMPNSLDSESSGLMEQQKAMLLAKLDNNLIIPKNFQPTAPCYDPEQANNSFNIQQPGPVANPQTVKFCEVVGIDDPLQLLVTLGEPQEFESFNLSLNNSNNYTTFVSDTDEGSPNLTSDTPRKRKSLSLPDPVNLIHSFETEESINELNQLGLSNSRSPNSSKSPKRSPDVLSDESGKEESNVSQMTDDSFSSTKKKFKRRNAAVYQYQDDS